MMHPLTLFSTFRIAWDWVEIHLDSDWPVKRPQIVNIMTPKVTTIVRVMPIGRRKRRRRKSLREATGEMEKARTKILCENNLTPYNLTDMKII